MELGTVIATGEAPTPGEFSFVVTAEGKLPVRRGQFVELITEEGRVVAFITNLVKTNRYFMRAESVKEYERGSGSLTSIFPVDRWEYLIAQARTLGVQGKDGLERVSFPPSPGEKVYSPGSEELAHFLGLNANGGVLVGELKHHALPVRLDLTKLLRKHVAVLAMSGAGKSHFASILLEELLERGSGGGCPAVVVVDVHGEYTSFAEPGQGADYSKKVQVIRGSELRVGVPNLSSKGFMEFVPELSGMQARELQRVLDELKAEMRSGKGPFGLDELVARVERNEGMHKHLKHALLSWLLDLHSFGVFDRTDHPNWERVLQPGKAVILDLSDVASLRKRQILITHAARGLFNSRKRGRVPPFVLCLEEAHQFCVGGDSLLLLPHGTMTIREFVERELANGKTSHGQVELATSPSNHRILSLGSDLKVHHFPVKQYLKLPVPERLRISLENGMELVTTPETLLLSVDGNGIKWVPAFEIKEGGYLGTINSVRVKEKRTYVPDLLSDEALVYLDRAFARELLNSLDSSVKCELGWKYYSWKKKSCLELGMIRKLAKEKGIPLEEIISRAHKIKMLGKGRKIPSNIDEKFLYFLGLMASDGHLSKCTRGKWPFYEVGFSNTDLTLVTLYRTLLNELFDVDAEIRSRVPNEPWSRVYRVAFGSKLLFHLLHRLGIHAGKNDDNDIPAEVMCAPKEDVKGYIRGLFDGDGWANDKARQVGVCNKSKTFLEKVRFLLLRFGIPSSIRENRDGNFELRVSGKDAKTFCAEISFNHPKKKRAAQKIIENASDFTFDLVPYPNCLRELRRKFGLSMREFGTCSRREIGRYNTTRGTLSKIINRFEDIRDPNLSMELKKVKEMVESNVRWCRVTKIEKLGGGDVYDLTVPLGHNLIANGVIVHNCPSSESKAAAISRPIIETIAREGRKFYASLVLISQRPVRLSTTVLSQASTNLILRITNPYDLEHLKQSSEAITSEVADMISSLPVGEALIVGEAVNHPIFIRVRERRSKGSMRGSSLEEAVLEFERRNQREREDAKAFM